LSKNFRLANNEASGSMLYAPLAISILSIGVDDVRFSYVSSSESNAVKGSLKLILVTDRTTLGSCGTFIASLPGSTRGSGGTMGSSTSGVELGPAVDFALPVESVSCNSIGT